MKSLSLPFCFPLTSICTVTSASDDMMANCSRSVKKVRRKMWRTEAKLFTERHIPPTASLRLITGSPLTNWWIDFSVLAYHFKEHVGMTSVSEPISKTPVAREWSAETSDGQIHYFFIHLQALALNYEICSVCISLTR